MQSLTIFVAWWFRGSSARRFSNLGTESPLWAVLGEPNEVQLARYFHLDEADLAFIDNRRGDQNRFGVALQLGCIRFLGTFGSDLSRVPVNTQWFVARQLGITDITILSRYAQRETTRREHQALIRHQYAYREWTWPWSFRLSRLLYTRSWISNERPSLLFDWATGWLIQHKILLPGASTLTHLISEVRERATNRLWLRLSALPTPSRSPDWRPCFRFPRVREPLTLTVTARGQRPSAVRLSIKPWIVIWN